MVNTKGLAKVVIHLTFAESICVINRLWVFKETLCSFPSRRIIWIFDKPHQMAPKLHLKIRQQDQLTLQTLSSYRA